MHINHKNSLFARSLGVITSNALYRDSNFHFRSVRRRFSISLYGRLNEIFEGFDSAINFYRRQRSRSLIHKTGQSRTRSRKRILVTSFSTHRNSARMYDPIFVAMIKIARFILWIYIRAKCNRTSLGESF